MRIEVVSVGTDITTGLTGITQTMEFEKMEGRTITAAVRVKFPSAAPGRLWIYFGGGQGESIDFVGTGAWQTVSFSCEVPSSVTLMQLRLRIRESASSIFPVVGDYYIQNVMVHEGLDLMPFVQYGRGTMLNIVDRYYEYISPTTLGLKERCSFLSTDSIYFHFTFSRKRALPVVTILGSESSGWNIQDLAAINVTGFTLTTNIREGGVLRITASKTAHGMTDAVLNLVGTPSGIVLDARPS